MKISPSLIDTFIKASYSEEPPQSIEDFQLDKELATRKAIVYSNADGQAIVCNRGTAPKVADWMNNVAYVVGAYNWTDRMNQAIEVQKKSHIKIWPRQHNQHSAFARLHHHKKVERFRTAARCYKYQSTNNN